LVDRFQDDFRTSSLSFVGGWVLFCLAAILCLLAFPPGPAFIDAAGGPLSFPGVFFLDSDGASGTTSHIPEVWFLESFVFNTTLTLSLLVPSGRVRSVFFALSF